MKEIKRGDVFMGNGTMSSIPNTGILIEMVDDERICFSCADDVGRKTDIIMRQYFEDAIEPRVKDDGEERHKITTQDGLYGVYIENRGHVCITAMIDHERFIRYDWSNHPFVIETHMFSYSILWEEEDTSIRLYYIEGSKAIRPCAVIMRAEK